MICKLEVRMRKLNLISEKWATSLVSMPSYTIFVCDDICVRDIWSFGSKWPIFET